MADHRCDRPDVVVLPGAEETPADQIVDLSFLHREMAFAGEVTVGMMA